MSALVIRQGETQRAFVERTLVEQGGISAHDAMFYLADEYGRRAAVTRLAPIIETLRKAGWAIDTVTERGEQAVYVLRGRPAFGHPVGVARECPSCHRGHAVGTTCASAA